jgi:hypothetical protein
MYRDEFVTCGGVPLKEVREVSSILNTLDAEHMGMRYCHSIHADKSDLEYGPLVILVSRVGVVHCLTSCCIGLFALCVLFMAQVSYVASPDYGAFLTEK